MERDAYRAARMEVAVAGGLAFVAACMVLAVLVVWGGGIDVLLFAWGAVLVVLVPLGVAAAWRRFWPGWRELRVRFFVALFRLARKRRSGA